MEARQKLLQTKDPETASVKQSSNASNNEELKFCLSWCLITTFVLVIVILIMLFWLNALTRSTMVGNSFLASMFSPTALQQPVILAWTQFHNQSLSQLFVPTPQCPYLCQFTDDRSKDKKSRIRLFHARDILLDDLPPVKENTLNVFFSIHSPMDIEFKWTCVNNLRFSLDFFNLTVGYQQDSTIQYPYGLFEPKSGDETGDEVYTDEQVESAIDNKIDLILASSSNCRTDSRREVLVERLQQMIPVTAVGDCFNSTCNEECLREFETNHYFYLAFEAAVCPDFLSERFWRLKNLIVPIVLTRGVVPSYIPSYTFIAVDDFPTLQEFVNYLFRVAKDREMYKSYFAWTKNYKRTNQVRKYLDPGCELCKLAYQSKRHVLRNIKDYVSYNQCKHAFSNYLLLDRVNRTWEIN